VLQIPKEASATEIYDRYLRLLHETRAAQQHTASGRDYNVAIVSDWLALVPRRNHGKDGVGANAAGMLGLVWLRDQKEREGWGKLGYTDHLAYLGIPQDESKL